METYEKMTSKEGQKGVKEGSKGGQKGVKGGGTPIKGGIFINFWKFWPIRRL